jgi:hypothetical protein
MMKKMMTLAMLSGGFLTALGWNCIPNIGTTLNLLGA